MRCVGGPPVRVPHHDVVAAGGFGRRPGVSRVELTKVTPVAAVPPIGWWRPTRSPVPVTVMRVPPLVGPLCGDTDVGVSVRVDVLV